MRLFIFLSSRRFLLTLLIAIGVVAVDVLSKRVVQDALTVGERHELIPGLLVLTHIQNTGAAYGLLAGQRWLLVLTAAIVAAVTPLLLRALPTTGRWAWSGPVLTGLILGGAIGNLTERARAGYVTDFIQVPPVPLFQVFNLSDACISVAVTTLLVISFFGGESARPVPRPDTRPASATEPADKLTG